jgi:hypothetical protein
MATNKKSSGKIFNNAKHWPGRVDPMDGGNKKLSGVIFNSFSWPDRVCAMDGSK